MELAQMAVAIKQYLALKREDQNGISGRNTDVEKIGDVDLRLTYLDHVLIYDRLFTDLQV